MSFLDNTGVQNLVNDLKGKTDAAYQEKLESGTNIKTVNGNSLLGNGDLEISGGAQTTWWGTSSTSAGTAAKVVVCEGFTLTAGAIISILFSAGNEAAVPTLNVNSTGVIPIRIGDSAPSWSNNTLKWSMGSVLTFVYDGTYFRYLGAKTAGAQTQPEGAGSWYGTSSTAATYAAKVCVVSTFRKTQGARVSITFSTANTYINGALTLNIDSTGASTIYVNNVATSASNTLLWDAGETLTFVYSGQYYYFVGRSKASGGGSVSYTTTTATLTVAGWSNNTQTVSVSAVTETSDVIIAAAPASISDYASAGIYCSAQAAGSLTFTCSSAPTNAITVNLMIFEGGSSVVRYGIAKTGAKASSVYIMDSSSVTGAIISEASDGETVYINSTDGAVGTLTAVRDDTGASLTLTRVTPSEYGVAYSFVMPPSPVTVTCPARGKD